jgi:ribose transport system ATP-binding protein
VSAPLLEVRGVGKAFPGVQALDGVGFTLRAGEILALIGENGAGKSTLMKILAGVHRPDAGELRLEGQPVAIESPRHALDLGIALIHQELNLCDNLTVAGALFLGRELRRGPFLRSAAMAAAARPLLQRVGLDVETWRLVATLAPGQKQLLEIARALGADARILILDEPTSSLTATETERLFAVVRELRAQGKGIVWISHRLAEVTALADRVLALRDGKYAGELGRDEIDHDRMVAMMVGRQLRSEPRSPRPPGAVVLTVRGLRTAAFPAHAIEFTLRQGEVVGMAGLLGAGRSEVLRAVFGADRALAGEIRVGEVVLSGHGPAAAAAAGVVLVPEDRKLQGLVLGMTVRENLSLPTLARRGFAVDRRWERALCASSIEQLSIRTPSGEQTAGNLSGGNQQKVVLGKWLAAQPKVLLLDEPTRGVDVGARAELYARLDALAAAGLAILFVSSDLEEVLMLADRVLVLHEGRLAGELPRAAMSEESILGLAVGRPAAGVGA